MKILLFCIRLLDRISPRLTVEWAAYLFATPKRIPAPSHELALIRGAEPIEFLCGLKAWKFGKGPPVVLMHGWEGRGSQMAAFAEPLVRKGYSVYAVDGPAHGASPGKQTTPVHFARFLMSVAQELGPLKSLIAHSFGAGSSVLAVHDGLETESLVIIAGPDRYSRVVDHYLDMLQLKPATRELFYKEITQRVGMTPQSLQVSNLAKKIKPKLLIVHDWNDKAVPYEASENIHQAVAESKMISTEGLGHRRILKDPAVIEKVVEFIVKN